MENVQTTSSHKTCDCRLPTIGKTFQLMKTMSSDQFSAFKDVYCKYAQTPMIQAINKNYFPAFVEYKIDPSTWMDRTMRLIEIGARVTIEKLTLLYGEEEGMIRWNSYCQKQSISNTFDYKREVYGFTEEDFKQYNMSRSVTLENMIKRHGEELGTLKFQEYCERQRYAGCSLEYYVDKLGKEAGELEWDRVCKSKAFTLENMIKRHGEVEGLARFLNHIESRPYQQSKIANQFFGSLLEAIPELSKFKTYHGEREFGIMSPNGYYKFDFTILELDLMVEFNGDYWHRNPKKYDSNYFERGLYSYEVWERDQLKIEAANRRGFDVLVVWESDYLESPIEQIQSISNIINERLNP